MVGLSSEEKDKTSLQLKELAEEYTKLDAQLSVSRDIMAGLSKETIQTGEAFGYTSEQINEAIDKLNFGEKLKDRIKVKDVAKDFSTIRKEATDTLSEIESKLKAMENAPGLFTPEQMAEQKEQLSLYTQFVDILGGDTEKRLKKQQAEAERQRKIEEDKLKGQKELAQREIELQLATDKAILSYMTEGAEKQKALADQKYKERLNDIKEAEQKDLAALNKSKGLKITDAGYVTVLPDDMADKYNKQRTAAEWEFSKEIQKINEDSYETQKNILDNATEAFISNIEKEKRAVNDKYDNLVKRARDAEMSQEQIDQININRDNELTQVQSDAALKLSSFYQKAFGDIENYAYKTLSRIIKGMNEAVDSAQRIDVGGKTMMSLMFPTDEVNEKGEETRQEIKMTLEEYTSFVKRIGTLNNKIGDTNPFRAIIDGIKELGDAAGDEKLEKINKIISGVDGIASVTGDVGEALTDTGSKAGETVSKVSTILGSTAKGASAGAAFGPWGAIIGGVIGLGSSLVKVFGGAKELSQETLRVYDAYLDVLDQVIEKQKEAISSSAGTEAVAEYEDAIASLEKQIEATIQIGEDYFNSGSGWNSSSHGVDQMEIIKQYEEELAAIGIDISDWSKRGTELFYLEAEQLEAIQTEIPMLWAQLDESTQEYLQTLIDLNEEYEELEASLNEALTSVSFDSVEDGLDDLIQSADTAFADVADSFEDYMRDAILNLTKEAYLNAALEEWYDQFADYAASGDALTQSEVDDLQKMYEEIYNTAQDMYDAALEAAGLDKESSSSSGITASAQSLTEETGNILASYLNAIRADVSAQREMIERQVAIMEANTPTFAEMHAELVKIQFNTLATANNTLRGADGTDEIKTLLKRLTTSGSGVKMNI